MAIPKKTKFAKSGFSVQWESMAAARERAKRLGFENFSAYIAALIHKDLHTPGGWLAIPPKRPKK